jgi:hypothetical protein
MSKSKSRTKSKGEVFTPPPLVHEIFDELPEDAFSLDKTYCDPACGDGVFLREMKLRLLFLYPSKVQHITFNQLYGVDILMDNAMDTIFNLLVANHEEPCPSCNANIKRIAKDKTLLPLHLELEQNELLALSTYQTAKVKCNIIKTTKDSINIKSIVKGARRDIIESEMDRGVTYFNFRMNQMKNWVTFPNIVCCDSLKYNFGFGREENFTLI